MKYKYPKISNVLTYKRIDAVSVEVVDHLTDNSFTFGINVIRYVRKLDGLTHPYKIPSVFSREEIDEIINYFNEYSLIRHNDTMRISLGTVLKTLWVPKLTPLFRLFAYISNALLMLSWLPALIIGIIMFENNFIEMGFDCAWLGFLLGLFLGVVFHELGHAFAGISYGATVFEIGAMVMCCVVPGAYVLLDITPVKRRLWRIQINAAGVEMNFLLCGLFLVLGATLPALGGILLNAAICNAFLGMINLSFVKGLDGASIISDLLGVDDALECATSVVRNRKTRKQVIHKSPGGYATVSVCYMLFALQISLPILLITNVLEVVSCFV